MSLVISSPGKVILHGEHAVVYGKAALATSVNLRCYVIFTPTQDRRVTLHLPDFVPDSDSEIKRTWTIEELENVQKMDDQEVQLKTLKMLPDVKGSDEKATSSILSMAILVFLYLLIRIYDRQLSESSGLTVTVISALPAGAGLGSSAAYSVCLAAGFLTSSRRVSVTTSSEPGLTIPSEVEARIREAGVEIGGCAGPQQGWSKGDLEEINKWGFEAEKLIHGTPSGIDNSVSSYGGAIHFQSGEIEHLRKMPSIRIMLINTKVPRSTKHMVAGVRERYDKFTSVINPILDSIENISKTTQHLLEQLSECYSCDQSRDDYQYNQLHSKLEELFRLNQHLLNAIGVGHPAIDTVCGLAESQGLGAKLTGGGGGGCVIALIPPGMSDHKLLQAKDVFKAAGFDCWETVIGSCGVSLHSVTVKLTS